MSTARSERTYLPAAGHDWFLPLYDPFTRLFGFETARRSLLSQADLQPDHRVLDVGCGTGTLAVLIKQLYPEVAVVAIDPDPKALVRAERKAARAGVSIRFDRGFADVLRYPDGSFDRVFSSMMLHHVSPGEKLDAVTEMRRVLKPGGRLELLDFAGSDAHGAGVLGRLMHAHGPLRDNSERRVLELMAAAGLDNPRPVGQRRTLFGPVAFYQAAA